jgi:hypothetical protein
MEHSIEGSGSDIPIYAVCGVLIAGSPCVLPMGHVGKHYTQAEREAWAADIAHRADERLDFLASHKLRSLGYPQPCDRDDGVSAAKDGEPLTGNDRKIIMIGLRRRLKEACLDRRTITLSEEEINSLLLDFEGRR